ncbi:AAA family ATPase [Brevibacillus laterosporus]|uniref:AAA family ATPase n=1 Tax=Brevibacillus laterosporus TaxID=1465 RepID=UPI0026510B07|nr:AAA family ATPase [Brevibacillus laterosporus]MDN9012686.1 AAA family ATPase [Brevibacillus laterosporus]MDO0943757.1 AAA family ATPase [Brevibacillus laterosporus]
MQDCPKKLLLVDEDEKCTSDLVEQLKESQYVKVCGVVSDYKEIFHTLQAMQPDIVLVGFFHETDLSLLCHQVRFYFPTITCIAACDLQTTQWEALIRNLGVFVLQKPISPSMIEMVVSQDTTQGILPPGALPSLDTINPQFDQTPVISSRNLSSHGQSAGHQQHLITVYGPKGGVGKTFISRELAIYYSRHSLEGENNRVLAIDFNLDLGTFATSLNLPRTPNLYTWVQEIQDRLIQVVQRDGRDPDFISHEEWQEYAASMALCPEEIERYIAIHPESGLHVLTSPRDIRQSFHIKDYHLYIILETIKRSVYNIVLIDTAPDTTDATIQALFFAERVVMVGSPVVDAIENIHRVLKLLREAEYPEQKIQICMNRLQKREMFTLEEMKAYFQLHPSQTLLTIPDDDEVKRSINTGIPLMLTTSRSQAKLAIEKLGQVLIPHTEKEGQIYCDSTNNTKKASFFKWFSKGGWGR